MKPKEQARGCKAKRPACQDGSLLSPASRSGWRQRAKSYSRVIKATNMSKNMEQKIWSCTLSPTGTAQTGETSSKKERWLRPSSGFLLDTPHSLNVMSSLWWGVRVQREGSWRQPPGNPWKSGNHRTTRVDSINLEGWKPNRDDRRVCFSEEMQCCKQNMT